MREDLLLRARHDAAGLMRQHGMSPDEFLDYVHDIDLVAGRARPELAAALEALPGRKFIFTNGSRRMPRRWPSGSA